MNESQLHAVELLAKEYDYGWGALHAHKVADLATSLFDQISGLQLFSDMTLDDRRTLMAAAFVHDIGASERAKVEMSPLTAWARGLTEPDRHGEKAFYLLRNRMHHASSDHPVSTLSPGDKSLLLYSILWHASPTTYVLDIEPVFDERKTLLLAGILRLADGLDCEHQLKVCDIRIQDASAWVRIFVHSRVPADSEGARAREKSDVLSRALGRRIFVQQMVEP